MAHYARITAYTRVRDDSPGWFLPAQFVDIESGKMKIPEKFYNAEAVSAYVLAWRALARKMQEKPSLVSDFFNLENESTHFTVLAFDTKEDWQEMMEFLKTSNDQEALLIARAEMAKHLGVQITVYEPIEIDFDSVEYFTAEHIEALIGQASTPDQGTVAA